MPLADLSITLVLVPSLRFPRWQWALLAMTLRVVTWCAWPFHAKALKAARHGGSSMDTLVSVVVDNDRFRPLPIVIPARPRDHSLAHHHAVPTGQHNHSHGIGRVIASRHDRAPTD